MVADHRDPRPSKGGKRLAAKRQVADHGDLRPDKGGKNVAREARAAEAKVSSSTMARAEFIAKRPEIAEKVRETWPDPLSTLSDVGERQRTARDEARSS